MCMGVSITYTCSICLSLLLSVTVSSQQLMSTIEITPGQEGQSQSTTQFLPASVYSVSIAAESSVGIGTPSEAITVSLLVGR